ncbi:hypothetical protein HYV12_02600 [Candidatus Dojkabacteria bacterium]|nr:hypothetical protein [Candidatus Dojkabacteria bacterium]
MKIVYIIGVIFSLLFLGIIFTNLSTKANRLSVLNTYNRVDSDTVDSGEILGETSVSLEGIDRKIEEIVKTEVVKKVDSPKTIHMIEEERYSKGSYKWEESGSEVSNTRSLSVEDRQLMYANSNSDKEVMGFLPYWQLSRYSTMQYDKLTSVAYFALTCYDNGEWVTNDSGYSGFHSGNFTNMVTLAHQKNAKVILVVKNFHNRSIRDLVANTGGAGDKLITNIVNAVRSKGLDGVNIDFEYIPDSNYPVTTTLRSNFVKWHDKLADRMHTEFPGSIVSTDVFGSSAAGYSAYDIAGLGATSIDYIMFMNYDYITTSCYDGKRIFPMSPLYGNAAIATNWNVSYHLAEAAKQAPSKKILQGIPYYGIDFEVRTSDKDLYNARILYYSGCKGIIETYGSIVDPEFDVYHNSNSIKWNNSEKATWYVYLYGGKWRHGYYDDPRSLGAKYDYVRSAKLGGIGIWALGYDAGSNDLWNTLRDKFQRGPYILAFSMSTSESRALQIISELKLDVISEIGNNAWKVIPRSGITMTSIQNAKKYFEVVVAEFENVNPERDIILP